MAITSIKTGSSFTNLTKYNDFLAGNAAFQPAAYESIATVTVGSGGASSVSFNSIPSGYQHLQIRGIQRTTGGVWDLRLQANSDTGNNYATHRLGGFGSGTFADGIASTSSIKLGLVGTVTSIFGGTVVDILDYKNTNKFKTVRSLNGYDENGGGYVLLTSGLWQNTNAITSLTLSLSSSGNFLEYSKFGLFGIKGA
jgi:hypothetical protein